MAFTDNLIQTVWNKARIVEGFDKDRFRKDACGAWIQRSEYGNHKSQYGWDIDHVLPRLLGGGDEEINLRPMQWQNNLSKADDFPYYFSAVVANERTNEEKKVQLRVNSDLYELLKQKYNI